MIPLFTKLNMGTADVLLVLNAPESFNAALSQLAAVTVRRAATATMKVPFVIGFATTIAERDRISATMARVADGDAVVWMAYPKGTSKKYRCEFNRDGDWSVLGDAGFEPVRQVAIDEDWSALRFRRVEHIKSLQRNNAMAISLEGKRRTRR